ncbi:MAG TPA: hypothetical protein VG389_27980 [Myxococcota bacterium]|nr:hypothetical protein [Myxococcota bacterium]
MTWNWNFAEPDGESREQKLSRAAEDVVKAANACEDAANALDSIARGEASSPIEPEEARTRREDADYCARKLRALAKEIRGLKPT